jgi:hypothetical protein
MNTSAAASQAGIRVTPAPLSAEEVRDLALTSLVPLLILSAICNQHTNRPLLLAVGQIVSTGGVIAAMLAVLLTLRHSVWGWGLVSVTVLTKVGRIAMAGSDEMLFAYVLAVNALFCTAGAIAALRCPERVARQFVFACIIGLPLMIAQLTGVGEWTQRYRMDLHDGGYGDYTQFPTLFRLPGDVELNTIQSRPAGFFPSNNLLSIVIVFALGLHFSQSRRRTLSRRDVALCATAVVSMAKIVFLAFGLLIVWLWLTGRRRQRKYMRRVLVASVALVWLYAALFPGVFAFTVGWDQIVLNFKLRWNDLLFASGVPDWMAQARDAMRDLPVMVDLDDPTQRQSGYATIAPILPYLAAAVAIVVPAYVFGLVRVRRSARRWFVASTSLLLMVALIPLVTSFLGAVILSFTAGFGCVPLFIALLPSYRRFFNASSDRYALFQLRRAARRAARLELAQHPHA